MLRGSVGFQNPTVHVSIVSQETCTRCQYDEHALWSCSSSRRNLPFSGSRSRSLNFLAKVTMEEVLDEGQLTATSKANLGLLVTDMRLKERQTARRNEEAVSCVFFSCQKFNTEQSFSTGSSVGWATDRESRKLCEATGAKRQSWAERECPSNAGLGSYSAFSFFFQNFVLF